MKKHAFVLLLAFAILATSACSGTTSEPDVAAEPPAQPEPTPEEKVAELDAACAEAADAIAQRQAETSLYDRLGGRDAIHAVVVDVVRRHQVNEQIARLMEGVDTARLIEQVTDFLSSATGGDVEYNGMDMAAAHAQLGLTNADFLAAGADMQAALEAAGVGENEIQEVMCAFASLRGEVVTQ